MSHHKFRTLALDIPLIVRTLLVQLTEECAEVQKAACKAQRAGLAGYHSLRPEEGTYVTQIASELGDVLALCDALVYIGVLDPGVVENARGKRFGETLDLLNANSGKKESV